MESELTESTEHPSEKPEPIEAYIASHPPAVQARLREMRALIRACAPEATEKISYGIPTFYLRGNLVHYAAFTRHVGFYPGADGIAHFAQELAPWKMGKGSVQFPLGEPLPEELLRRIVSYRVEQNLQKRPARPR